EADGVRLARVFLDGLLQHAVLAEAEQRAMKPLVGMEHRARVALGHRAVVFALDLGQLAQGLGRQRTRQRAGGLGLEQFAHLVELGHFLRGERAHLAAHMLAPLDQPAPRQLGQHLARGMALQAEAADQVVLDQAFARMQAAQHDVFFEHAHRVGDGGIGGRGGRRVGQDLGHRWRHRGWPGWAGQPLYQQSIQRWTRPAAAGTGAAARSSIGKCSSAATRPASAVAAQIGVYEPVRSNTSPPSQAPRNEPTWWLRKHTPNSVPRWRVPNTLATSPLVSGTVPSQVSPITAANSTTDSVLLGSRKNAAMAAPRIRYSQPSTCCWRKCPPSQPQAQLPAMLNRPISASAVAPSP